MRKKALCIFMLFVLSAQVQASSYVAISCNDMTVLKQDNAHYVQSVASISKVMSAMIAVEYGNLDDLVTIGNDVLKTTGSSVYLKPQQQLTLRALLYGLLLRSGNDAASSIAHYIGEGDVATFVRYMNEKAARLGMQDSQFRNPSGLDDDDDGNTSSAYDMAVMMCAASAYPSLQEIMRTKTYRSGLNHVWGNKNRLLSMMDGLIGGKTGFTKQAGRTLVSAADQAFPIAVATLRMGDDFNFHKQLYSALYAKYRQYILVRRGDYMYQNYRFRVDKHITITTNAFAPENVQVLFDSVRGVLVLTYQDDMQKKQYTIEGRQMK